MKKIALLFMIICFTGMVIIPSAGAECTRSDLKGFADKYFTALQAHDPSRAPLASNVKYTENGIEKAVGEGFWKTAGKILMRRDLLDTKECGTHSNVVIEEPMDSSILGAPGMSLPGMEPRKLVADGTPRPIMYGVRLKVKNDKITEIEAIIAREHEFAFNVEEQLATKDQDWEGILSPEERSSRLAMIAAADDYFDMFSAEPSVRTPFARPCDRWENGLQTTKSGMETLAGEDGQAAAMQDHDCTPKGLVITNHGPRRFVVDVESGQVVALMHFAGSLPDFHVFKMKNGQVYLINAVIGAGCPSMGWPIEPVCK